MTRRQEAARRLGLLEEGITWALYVLVAALVASPAVWAVVRAYRWALGL